MKKILSVLALAMLLVACGGEKKKELTVEEQAKAYCEQAYEALQAGDMEKLMTIGEEVEKWYEGLSDEDKAKADAASS